MCTGLELAAIGAIAGTAVTAYGQYTQGQNAQKMADYNADVQRVKAEDAANMGAVEENRHRQKVQQFIGSQTAAMGASGTAVGSGSSGAVLDQTAAYGELDALTIRSNALKSAWGFESQAKVDNLEGAIAAGRGRGAAASTLLSATPSVYKSGSAAGWWKA